MASPHDISEPSSPLSLQICNMLNAPADEYFTFQVTLPSARPPSQCWGGGEQHCPHPLHPHSLHQGQKTILKHLENI